MAIFTLICPYITNNDSVSDTGITYSHCQHYLKLGVSLWAYRSRPCNKTATI